MNFYYTGKRPSKRFSIANNFITLIGVVAIIFLVSSIDNLQDIQEYLWQIIFIIIAITSIFYDLFKKKGEVHSNRIEIKEGFLIVNKLKISLNKTQLNIYKTNDNFTRYHFWDSIGIFSIYSVYNDDFLEYFSSNFPDNTFEFKETSASRDGANFRIKTDYGNLNYDLESGEYSIKKDDKPIFNKLPELFIYDPKYKQGKPLNK